MASSSSDPLIYKPLPQAPEDAEALQDGLDEEPEYRVVDSAHGAPLDARVRWIHFIFGCAVLLPWNALITATPYFLSRLSGTALESSFSSYLSITFTVANFGFLAHATITSKQSSPSRRTFVSTLFLALLVGLLTLSTAIKPGPTIFFAFVLLNGIAQACAGSYLQTAVTATASVFGPSAMQAMMSGQAFVGVVVSGVQVLSAMASVHTATIAAEDGLDYDESKAAAKSAALFFGLSTLFLVATLYAAAWLVRLPAYKSVIRPLEHARSSSSSSANAVGSQDKDRARIFRVFKSNIPYEFAVSYVFLVTLAVFPPITASVQPSNPSQFSPLVFTGLHFFLFNVGDLGGRYLCATPKLLVWDAKKLVGLSVLRTLFIPLFLLCNVKRHEEPYPFPGIPGASEPTLLPRLLSTTTSTLTIPDLSFFLLLLLFGLSNGYVSSMCMIAAPNLDKNPRLKGKKEDVDVAATLAGFCLVGGLALGSATSFGVRARVCGCNLFTG